LILSGHSGVFMGAFNDSFVRTVANSVEQRKRALSIELLAVAYIFLNSIHDNKIANKPHGDVKRLYVMYHCTYIWCYKFYHCINTVHSRLHLWVMCCWFIEWENLRTHRKMILLLNIGNVFNFNANHTFLLLSYLLFFLLYNPELYA